MSQLRHQSERTASSAGQPGGGYRGNAEASLGGGGDRGNAEAGLGRGAEIEGTRRLVWEEEQR